MSEGLKNTSEQVEPGKEVVTPLLLPCLHKAFPLQPPRNYMPVMPEGGAACAVPFEDQKGDEMWVRVGRGPAGQKSK